MQQHSYHQWRQANWSNPIAIPQECVEVRCARMGVPWRQTNSTLANLLFGNEHLKEFKTKALIVNPKMCKNRVKTWKCSEDYLSELAGSSRDTTNKLNYRQPNWKLPECCKWHTYIVTNYYYLWGFTNSRTDRVLKVLELMYPAVQDISTTKLKKQLWFGKLKRRPIRNSWSIEA